MVLRSTPFVSRIVLRDAPVLSYGIEKALRTSNPSNRIEATGFAGKKDVPLASRTIVDCVSHA
jgi:hypothetical protein